MDPAKVGRVQAWCYQITHRATAGQDRYNTRWGCEQYYWNDITHPIHLYTGYLKSLIYELDKQLKAAKAETAYQKKCKVEAEERTVVKTMQLTQQMNEEKNEEKQYIRSLLQQERANKNHFYNKYRQFERLFQNKCQQFERVQRELTSMKNKLNAVQSPYTFTKSAGETNQQEKKFILDTVNNVDKNNRVSEVRKNIMKKYGGQWGVVIGLSPGQWSCLSSWDKWYIFSSNKKQIFIWKQKTNPIPLQTPYKLQNSYGILSTEDKQTIEQTLNSVIVSDDSVSNKCRNIRTKLIGKLGGEWGVVIGLKEGWGAYYWWDAWAVYSSNLQTVFIWKRCPQSEKKEVIINEEHNDDLNLLYSEHENATQNVEQQKVTKVQTENIELDSTSQQNKKDTLQFTQTKEMQQPIEQIKSNFDQGFILIQNAGSKGVQEETFIKVLINELMLPTEDPFVRSQWVSELAEKNFGNKWGALVNVSLCQWAQKQDYLKWFVYQSGQKQVLIWCKDGQHESKNKEELFEQIKQLPQLFGQVYKGQPKQEAEKQSE